VHGFVVVKTYIDAGRSGLVLKRRPGLQKLLKDVTVRAPGFKTILIDDISRWGRFQDIDESAHYEFLCKQSGVPIHYCSESFPNDTTLSSSMLKGLQRNIAAEYSRELSVKSFNGQKHLAELGFRVGGQAGYGLRRMVVSPDGSTRSLRSGEYKIFQDDRVVLTLGPQQEVDCVREIFRMVHEENKSASEIARELNRRGIPHPGVRHWKVYAVDDILRNPKYAGIYIWNKESQKLHGPRVRNSSDQWVVRLSAPAIVDRVTFDRVQGILHSKRRRWSTNELLEKLKQLQARSGRLSARLVKRTPGMPSLATYHRHLGCFRTIYRLLGYSADEVFGRSDRRRSTQTLRDDLVEVITTAFPNSISVTHLSGKRRPILKFGSGFLVSLLICTRREVSSGKYEWVAYPASTERQNITLLGFANGKGTGFSRYYVVPRIATKASRLFVRYTGKLLRTGFRLRNLRELPDAIRILGESSRQITDLPRAI
jgi:DNA invertase Pin-like site-specific DNA recombinase